MAEASEGDRRVLKIVGYKQAAADVIALLYGGEVALTMKRDPRPTWAE